MGSKTISKMKKGRILASIAGSPPHKSNSQDIGKASTISTEHAPKECSSRKHCIDHPHGTSTH